MPVRKVKGGYRWGRKGKIYPTREQALKQGRAIEMRVRKKNRRKNKGGVKWLEE